MSETRYRLVFLALGLALIGVIVFAVIFGPDASDPGLPAAIERVAPEDGATVLRQTDLVIDMAVGYEIELFIDGRQIPETEIDTVEATGVRTWVTGPGKTFDEWTPGLLAILVRYDRVAGGVDIGELRWVFRAQ